ncbi:MAG TPA: A/G-specific adenine glycosylase [Lachnospiraceae bacterium]|nr:A/G-specific adenine glycosylase [Lachnospiraceae bacterium]
MKNVSELSDNLLKWYQKNKRNLPWREEPTPYHVWLSEIMLQQTRASAVIPYYERFLGVLPDVKALAEAGEDTCLKLWEGLGYYSRVRNLHRAAVEIMEKYDGQIPSDSGRLVKLPGIGKYTSAAIASIAFGERIPAVDGNLLRVYARLERYGANIRDPKAFQSAFSFYKERMPEPERDSGEGQCGNFNQALMDLGATVCLPNTQPLCGSCPLAGLCRAHTERSGREAQYPVMPDKKEKKTEHLTVFVIRSGEKTAVRKRPGRGLLAGLYEFPNEKGILSAEEAAGWLREHSVEPLRITKLCDAEHVFTHKIWKMTGYEVQADSFYEDRIPFIMADEEEIREKYCVPSAFSAYLVRLPAENAGAQRR